MTNWAVAREKKWNYRLSSVLREWDRKAGKYDRTRRIQSLLGDLDGRDWPHKLMALTGRNHGGNWSPPHAPDLYIRVGAARTEDRKAIQTPKNEWKPFVTKHAMTAWDGVKRGEEWKTFDWQDDAYTLRVGWLGDDGRIHDSGIGGSFSGEMKLFKKWFIWDSWIKSDWFGLRRWLYYKGLHYAVHQKRPFACHALPPRGSGGYDHWYCEVPIGFQNSIYRRLGIQINHQGPHIYRAMRWDENGRVQSTVSDRTK
jgi:hypothetical protein